MPRSLFRPSCTYCRSHATTDVDGHMRGLLTPVRNINLFKSCCGKSISTYGDFLAVSAFPQLVSGEVFFRILILVITEYCGDGPGQCVNHRTRVSSSSTFHSTVLTRRTPSQHDLSYEKKWCVRLPWDEFLGPENPKTHGLGWYVGGAMLRVLIQ